MRWRRALGYGRGRRRGGGRFSAEDLAEASALLSVLFRRWMELKRRGRR